MLRPAICHAVNDEDDDGRDLIAAAAGEPEAFGRIYGRHAAVVLSLCRRSTRAAASTTDAEDATQETFIRAFNMLDTLDRSKPLSIRSWLFAIARRVCSERRRSALRRTWHEAQAIMQTTLMLREGSRLHESNGCEADEQLDRLGHALDQLDEQERLAIHLHYLEADPVGAAASALGLSRSGYYKLLARARQRLAALMSIPTFPGPSHQGSGHERIPTSR